MRGWAQLLEDEDLSDPTSTTAKAVSNRLPSTLPVFLGATEVVNLHSHTYIKRLLVSTKAHKNCILDPMDDKKGIHSYYSRSSQKNNRSETGFFSICFRRHKKWPYCMETL